MDSRRLPAVDALRGLAALFVVWQHYSEAFVSIPSIAKNGRFLADIAFSLDFGRIGVLCFFLISGFVIPASLKPGRPHPLGVFAVRRFFRLFPAYWVALLIGVVSLPLFNGTHFSTGTIVANIAMVQTFVLQPNVWGLFWTLEVELAFYVFCVLLFSFGLLNQARALFIACVGFTFLFGVLQVWVLNAPDLSPQKALAYMPLMLAVMLIGTLCRKFYDEGMDRKTLRTLVLATLICFSVPLLIMAAAAVGRPLMASSYRFGLSHLLGLALFLGGLGLLKRAPRAFVWIGTVSYSVYLFHPVVSYAAVYYLRSPSGAWALGGHVSIYMAASLAACLLLAAAVYYGIENPAIKLGHRLSKRLQSRE